MASDDGTDDPGRDGRGDGATEKGFSIRGRVQGVGFRWWTRKTAESLGLTGAVKNLRDGTVEVRVRGPEDAVETLAGRLRRGPSSARVDEVEEVASELPVPDDGFRIVR